MWCPPTTSTRRSNTRILRKAYKVHKLKEIESRAADFEVIAIDEGQFFTDVGSPNSR